MKIIISLQLLALMLFNSCNQHGNVTIFPAPGEISPSGNFQVFVNNQSVFVYETRVFFELNNPNRTSSFVQFDMQGKVKIEVASSQKIESVRLRPSNLNIPYIIKDNRIIFSIVEPRKISVEINGEIDKNLLIFANAPEKDAPNPDTPGVLYYGPGIHYIDGGYGFLQLQSNQTLYLAGGAILRARIKADNAINVKIKGRGILDGSTLLGRHPDYYRSFMSEPDTLDRPDFVHFTNCSNIEIDGVIFTDSPGWMLVFSSCEKVMVNNLKEFGYVDNTDGIDVVGSKDVTINDIFTRNCDDCIVIKGHKIDVENVNVTNSILWSDRAQAMQIGHETLVNSIKDVYFSNIDVLEQRNRYIGHYALGIFNGDSGVVSDVSFENIRVENCERLISLIIEKGYYNVSSKRGKIENIHFKNIRSYKTFDIHLDGFSEEYAVRNISFENIYLNDKPAKPEIYANPFVYNISFKQDGNEILTISSPIAKGTSYTPIDITKWCNRSRTDIKPADGKGWFDLGPDEDMGELKGGTYNFTGIPFLISNDMEKGAIILRSGQYLTEQPYASYPVKVSQKVDYLFLLQATAFTNCFVDKVPPVVWIGKAGKLFFNQSPSGTCLWYYVVRFREDGSELTIPVKAGWNVEDWDVWAPGGWVVPLNGKKFYIQKWDNPFPDKTVEYIKMYSSLCPEVPVLLAVTAGKKKSD
jgi:hypothetical protein